MTLPAGDDAQQEHTPTREDAATVLDVQARFIAACMQLPAGKAHTALGQAAPEDFTEPYRTIWDAAGLHATQLGKQHADAAPDWVIVQAELSKAGHLDHRHDTGIRAALIDVALCDANGLLIPQLLEALKQETYQREMTAFKELVALVDTHPAPVALETIQTAFQRVQDAAHRTTTPTSKAGTLHAAA